MAKMKHEVTGLTPERAPTRLKTNDDEEDANMKQENFMAIQTLQELQQEMTTARVQTAYLLAQHADTLREKPKKEFLVGGWSTFVPDATNLEDQGIQLEHQADCRERFIKEIVKKAGISSFYYRA